MNQNVFSLRASVDFLGDGKQQVNFRVRPNGSKFELWGPFLPDEEVKMIRTQFEGIKWSYEADERWHLVRLLRRIPPQGLRYEARTDEIDPTRVEHFITFVHHPLVHRRPSHLVDWYCCLSDGSDRERKQIYEIAQKVLTLFGANIAENKWNTHELRQRLRTISTLSGFNSEVLKKITDCSEVGDLALKALQAPVGTVDVKKREYLGAEAAAWARVRPNSDDEIAQKLQAAIATFDPLTQDPSKPGEDVVESEMQSILLPHLRLIANLVGAMLVSEAKLNPKYRADQSGRFKDREKLWKKKGLMTLSCLARSIRFSLLEIAEDIDVKNVNRIKEQRWFRRMELAVLVVALGLEIGLMFVPVPGVQPPAGLALALTIGRLSALTGSRYLAQQKEEYLSKYGEEVVLSDKEHLAVRGLIIKIGTGDQEATKAMRGMIDILFVEYRRCLDTNPELSKRNVKLITDLHSCLVALVEYAPDEEVGQQYREVLRYLRTKMQWHKALQQASTLPVPPLQQHSFPLLEDALMEMYPFKSAMNHDLMNCLKLGKTTEIGLKHYVTGVRGCEMSGADGTEETLLDQVLQFLGDGDDSKTLLIEGAPGAGKTLFLFYLEGQLEGRGYTTVSIKLATDTDEVIDKKIADFADGEKRVVILDGYDETHKDKNVVHRCLKHCPSSKAIVTCRSQYLDGSPDRTLPLRPRNRGGGAVGDEVERVVVLPFSPPLQEEFLTLFFHENPRGQRLKEKCQRLILECDNQDGFSSLFFNPFLLGRLVLHLDHLLPLLKLFDEFSSPSEKPLRDDLMFCLKSRILDWITSDRHTNDKSKLQTNSVDIKSTFLHYLSEGLAIDLVVLGGNQTITTTSGDVFPLGDYPHFTASQHLVLKGIESSVQDVLGLMGLVHRTSCSSVESEYGFFAPCLRDFLAAGWLCRHLGTRKDFLPVFNRQLPDGVLRQFGALLTTNPKKWEAFVELENECAIPLAYETCLDQYVACRAVDLIVANHVA